MNDREQARTELASHDVAMIIQDIEDFGLADGLCMNRALVFRALGMERVGLRMPKDGTDGVWVELPPDSGAP